MCFALEQLGSYFGASICAVDLNADSFSDLLVGAPMESTIREEGRVYVYINSGLGAEMDEMETVLIGSDKYAARFGESIANLGDIDNDGFEDIAIGAPQEDDLRGAIYIYNGRVDGISSTYSQRIEGLQISESLRMFGQSISGQIDADNNGYVDVAVGAFRSDSAVLLRPYENKTYLAVGSMKTIMLNVSLFNAGDDAYETTLNIQLPTGLYFIKILDLEEKQINCEVTESSGIVKLACSLGYIYVDRLSRIDVSFLLDVSSLSRADEDLSIIVQASCENEGEMDQVKDNKVTLVIPLRYEVMLTVHGFVNPTSFVYGSSEENEPETCMAEKLNFTFHYCMKADLHCLDFLCNFGKMESGKEASVHIQLEGRPSVLEMDETSSLKFEIRATAFPEPHPKVIELNKDENIVHAGFFKRQYKSIVQEENRRDSWSYVDSKSNDD
ncbi:Integrin alpha-4 [Cricetulus griseus]|uniref:Integrin alpha-4 n=1 Tax=Cricetulus griseus TaxID=10029 RepID=G3HDP7_CRIGR|nr:Integrin alpha-4 [Cricetulus griseus]